MAEFVSVGKAEEVRDGEVRAFQAGGETIAVASVGGSLYAFDDICSHAMCSLSEGDLEGTKIVCPCHDSWFDITTGEVLNPPAYEPIATFPIRVQDGQIQVEV
ncbi:MAG: non-heme iron oxygenase ferredoxin subunit [Actinomycetota bacterium]|nr:non-heme iron oxygenase ferredoxin subunit [Actinomycetota bacterium]